MYYGIGKYVSQNSRKGFWGTGALEAISANLRKMLPGLRGFGATQLREMRLFYEEWSLLDANSSVATDEIEHSNSSVVTDELQIIDPEVDIIRELQFTNSQDFPFEDFFRVPFTHHSRIIAKVKDMDARYYYIHRCAEEHMSVERLKQVIGADEYHHEGTAPNNFLDKLENKDMARKAVTMKFYCQFKFRKFWTYKSERRWFC